MLPVISLEALGSARHSSAQVLLPLSYRGEVATFEPRGESCQRQNFSFLSSLSKKETGSPPSPAAVSVHRAGASARRLQALEGTEEARDPPTNPGL
ncbi:hypothetical protein SKAU_G00167240 [Synaphobranchus kaupii]|uniref:Uncharacterized protein n=1 Tax=Synaphobranchus kaupii TaxID=118154 RepID=A0A9Q1FJP3_SYNKA|nr:hypothetical protein SKAU_G00167240 [Synaphobranchus kaupii]